MVLCGVCDDGHPGFLHPALPLLPHRFLENWCARVRARTHTHTTPSEVRGGSLLGSFFCSMLKYHSTNSAVAQIGISLLFGYLTLGKAAPPLASASPVKRQGLG